MPVIFFPIGQTSSLLESESIQVLFWLHYKSRDYEGLTLTIFSGKSQSGGQGGQVHESPEHHRGRVQDGRVAGEGGAGIGELFPASV